MKKLKDHNQYENTHVSCTSKSSIVSFFCFRYNYFSIFFSLPPPLPPSSLSLITSFVSFLLLSNLSFNFLMIDEWIEIKRSDRERRTHYIGSGPRFSRHQSNAFLIFFVKNFFLKTR